MRKVIDKEQMAQGYIYMGKINLEESTVAASTNFDGEKAQKCNGLENSQNP